jgi:hypothetical protein
MKYVPRSIYPAAHRAPPRRLGLEALLKKGNEQPLVNLIFKIIS